MGRRLLPDMFGRPAAVVVYVRRISLRRFLQLLSEVN